MLLAFPLGPLFPSYPQGLLKSFSSGSQPLPQITFPKAAQTQLAHLVALCPFPECRGGPYPVQSCRTPLASFPSIPVHQVDLRSPFAAAKVQTSYLVTFAQGSQPSTCIPGLAGSLCETHVIFTLRSVGEGQTLGAVPPETTESAESWLSGLGHHTLPNFPGFFSPTRPRGQGPGPSGLTYTYRSDRRLSILICFYFSRQGLTVQARLAWNLLYIPGWFGTQRPTCLSLLYAEIKGITQWVF